MVDLNILVATFALFGNGIKLMMMEHTQNRTENADNREWKAFINLIGSISALLQLCSLMKVTI